MTRKVILFLFSLMFVTSSFGNDISGDFFKELKKSLEKERLEFDSIERDIESKIWVKEALSFMYSIDQIARKSVDKVYKLDIDEIERLVLLKKVGDIIFEIDSQNIIELKKILKIYGWIKISDFGNKYDLYAWILVQHADNDRNFQVEALEKLTKLVLIGETSKQNYAYLFDRVSVSFLFPEFRKPQRFGTQGQCVAKYNWQPFELEDTDNLNEIRRKYDLSTFEEYKKIMDKYCLSDEV